MKNFLLWGAAIVLQFTASKTYAQFTPGNLVVEIPQTTATATPASIATPVVLQEYTTSGTLVSTVNIPYTGASRLTISGSAGSEGEMTLSAERDRLVIVGYDADSGTASIASTTSAADARVIGTVSPLGVFTRVDTTHTRFSANNIRSGTAFGTNYIAAGGLDGIILMNDGSQISTTNTNNRCVQVYNNQMYSSASSGSKGIGSVGTGIPVTTGQTETLLAADATSNGAYSYAISPDGNTLYVADASSGILKYTRTGGTGTFTAAIYTVCTTPCTGIAVNFSTANPTIYAVPATNLSLISLVDAGTTATATTIATTTATSPFRSVMFAPSAYASVTVTGTSVFCTSGSTTVTFTGNPYATVTYNVNGGNPQTIALDYTGTATYNTGTLTPVGGASTNYIYNVVNVINPSGTTAITGSSATITVNPIPTVTVTGDSSVCANSSTNIIFTGTPNAVIFYSANTTPETIMLNASGIASITPAFTTVDTTYTITNAALNTCSQAISGQADTVHIALSVTPSVFLTASPNDTICMGGQISFTATTVNGGAMPQYEWHNNGIAINGATDGTYTSSSLSNNDVITCVLTTSFVCATVPVDSTSDTITVNPVVIPSVSVTLNPGNLICATDTLQLTANPANGGTAPQYQWLQNGSAVTGATNATFSPEPISNGDQFSVVMTNNAVCPNQVMDTSLADTETVTAVASFTSTVSVSPGTNISQGEQANFSATSTNGGSVTYQWYIDGQAVSGATNATYSSTTINNNDTVTCIVSSNATCIDTSNALSNSIVMQVSSGINELSTGIDNVLIYPNPTTGQLTVKGAFAGTDKTVCIQLIDLVGQVISNDVAPAVNGSFNKQLSLSDGLANGMYMLRVSGSGQSKVINFTLNR